MTDDMTATMSVQAMLDLYQVNRLLIGPGEMLAVTIPRDCPEPSDDMLHEFTERVLAILGGTDIRMIVFPPGWELSVVSQGTELEG